MGVLCSTHDHQHPGPCAITVEKPFAAVAPPVAVATTLPAIDDPAGPPGRVADQTPRVDSSSCTVERPSAAETDAVTDLIPSPVTSAIRREDRPHTGGSGSKDTAGTDTSDDSILTRLGPDLPQLVALLYPVADLGAVGGELQVDLRTLTEERSFFEGTMRWYPGEVGATVQVSRTEQIPPAMIDEQ